jgi:hypothetical protein
VRFYTVAKIREVRCEKVSVISLYFCAAQLGGIISLILLSH